MSWRFDMRLTLALLTSALLLTSVSGEVRAAQTDLPVPRHYVEDYANVINPSDEQSLNGVLQELEQKTGAQYIVLTVQTTAGVPIEQFSIELAEKWKLGQKGKDNGMLFVLAAKDRRYRFEVGYGLEGFVTDQYCDRVAREFLVPYLKKGDYSQGIYQANSRIAQTIAAESDVALTGMPKLSPPPAQSRRPVERGSRIGLPCCGVLPLLFILLLLFGGLGRGMGWWFFLPFMLGGFGSPRGYGRSGSYGGGSFGGGFGGFGGGMGGGFGGGGASGGW
jgi:uncharacterized protein